MLGLHNDLLGDLEQYVQGCRVGEWGSSGLAFEIPGRK